MHNRAHKVSPQQTDKRMISGGRGWDTMAAQGLAAPQGFEPQYADSESAVLPLNEGAIRERAQKKASLLNILAARFSVNRLQPRGNETAQLRLCLFFAQHLEWFLLQNAIRCQPSGDAGQNRRREHGAK